MARVRFLRGTALGGIGNDAAPGDERDLPDTQAAQLIALGRAVEVPAAAATPAPTFGDAQKPTRRKVK
jgi:hypothetical protein